MSGGPDRRRGDGAGTDARRNKPLNRLVPYLDLFTRLDDGELARLAGVDEQLVATLRRQVDDVSDGLAQYLDLLPRLSDEELVRLSGASPKTIRFWRLCQPRSSRPRAAATPIEQPVADWSSEPPTKPGHTSVTPGPAAPWDRTGTVSSSGTVLTPIGETPDVTRTIDPAESQQSAAQLMDFEGAPFPGYEEWRPALARPIEEDDDFTVELDR